MRYGPSQSDDCKIFKLTISLERNDEIVCVLVQSHENLVDLQIMGLDIKNENGNTDHRNL